MHSSEMASMHVFAEKCSQNYKLCALDTHFCKHLTMADNAAMRQALIEISFMQDVAQAIVDDQGIDSLEEIVLLKDDEIPALCKIVQRPGSAYGDKDHTMSHKAEKNLKLCAYLIKH